MRILCLDVGSGTQDVLYWTPDRSLENCPKFVLPSPAKLVAARIRKLTAEARPLHLFGRNMGGGFFGAVREHLRAGLAVSAHSQAALALSDDPPSLSRHGITLSETCPKGHTAVALADYDPGFWHALLAQSGLEPPDLVLACAQDHGHHPGQSSRIGRFRLWEDALAEPSHRLEDMLYDVVPQPFTRLAALQDSTGGGPVMDTGPAAALGVLFEPDLEQRINRDGALIVNMGNSHVLGLLVHAGRLAAVYEHHTGQIQPGELASQLERFRAGDLTCEEVFDSGGHGCALLERQADFAQTFVIGPRRREYVGAGAEFPAPGGDMMLTGCFGLLKAWEARN
ncbi:DUF1786 domain-containing protein [Fundidesulfovibrio putealis]|uniref:DUF1786 domain-containing protein n=1 Tax=Fundidesulfovibrio putealis TaxID=270496 RepID=UPI000429FE70|nr:DUF1786 domain-containing protein [Fundidesulfovibrio putealis]